MPDTEPSPLRRPGDRLDLSIADDPRIVRRIRLVIAESVADLVPLPKLTDVVIVVSELVSNAIKHGDEPRHLRLSVDETALAIEITDGGSGGGAVTDLVGRGGHGRRVVEMLSTEWGAASDDGGTRVWARIAIPAIRAS
ncbi:MAG: ATP-binding protein [Acidimicrobiales bacterium]